MLSSLKESGQPLSNTSRNLNGNQDRLKQIHQRSLPGTASNIGVTAFDDVYSGVIADMT
jgi:hypothetical protein